MSPEELGHKVGLSGMTIRRIEAGIGQPTIRTRFLIARELDMEVTTLWPSSLRTEVAA